MRLSNSFKESMESTVSTESSNLASKLNSDKMSFTKSNNLKRVGSSTEMKNKKPSSPSIFAKMIASALGKFLDVDEGQIQTSLLSDAIISLSNVQLKPQFDVKEEFIVRGTIAFIEFKWEWIMNKSKFLNASIKNAVLTIQGVDIFVASKEKSDEKTSKKSFKKERNGSNNCGIDDERNKEEKKKKKKKKKGFVNDILSILTFKIHDVSISLKLPPSSMTRNDIFSQKNQTMVIRCDNLNLLSLGRKMRNGKQENQKVKVLSASSLLGLKGKKKSLRKGGNHIEPILSRVSIRRFQVYFVKENLQDKSKSLPDLTEYYESRIDSDYDYRQCNNHNEPSFNNSQGKIPDDKLPLLEPFSYSANITRFRGERFDNNIQEGILIEGEEVGERCQEDSESLSILNHFSMNETIGDVIDIKAIDQDNDNSSDENILRRHSSIMVVEDREEIEVCLLSCSSTLQRSDMTKSRNSRPIGESDYSSTDTSDIFIHLGPKQSEMLSRLKGFMSIQLKKEGHSNCLSTTKSSSKKSQSSLLDVSSNLIQRVPRRNLLIEAKKVNTIEGKNLNIFSKLTLPISSFAIYLPIEKVLRCNNIEFKHHFDGTMSNVSASSGIFYNNDAMLRKGAFWSINLSKREIEINTLNASLINRNCEEPGVTDRIQHSKRKSFSSTVRTMPRANHMKGQKKLIKHEDESSSSNTSLFATKSQLLEIGQGLRCVVDLVNQILLRTPVPGKPWSISFQGKAELRI